MDDYVFRREFDFATDFPEIIAELKTSRQFRKMDLEKKKETYDSYYKALKNLFLSGHVSKEEKNEIEHAATQQILERGWEEW